MKPFFTNKLFTILVITLPILSVYKSPVKNFDLGTLLILIFTPIVLYKTKFSIVKNKSIIFLLFYIFLSSVILLSMGYMDLISILRLAKFILVIFVVLLAGYNNLFDSQYALKILKIVTNLAVAYLMFQVISNKLFGIVIPNGIPSLAESDGYLKNQSIAATRPSSFFLEPAHFAQYSLVYLSYCLFGHVETGTLFKNWKNALFISIGIILSTSGQGLLLLGVLIGIWLVSKISLEKLTLKKWLILLFSLLIIIGITPILFNSEVITSTLTRLFTDNTAGGGNAMDARLGGYEYLNLLTGINSVIGLGYGNIPDGVYLSGYAYIIYCIGYLGFIIFGSVLINVMVKVEKYQRILVVLFSIILIGAQAFNAASISFYFALFWLQLNSDENSQPKILKYNKSGKIN